MNTADTCTQRLANPAELMPYTSLLAVLKPKCPLTSQRSCRTQPTGMTLLAPSQYIQNETVVLAPAAVLAATGRFSAPPVKSP